MNNFICLISLPALGKGWEPVVIDSAPELIFIKEYQKGMSNNQSYFIAGSTNIETGETLTIFDYLPDNSGTLY